MSSKRLSNIIAGKLEPTDIQSVANDNVKVISRFSANKLLSDLLKKVPGGEKK